MALRRPGQVNANRKKFRGTLERAESGGWQIVWSDEPAGKPGQKVSKKRVPAPLQALGFTLDELRDARLAPIVDFKGVLARRGRALPEPLIKNTGGRLPHGGQPPSGD
jgi:ribosome maturation factor RimP